MEIIWAFTWENVPFDMCAERRFKLACASARSDQSLGCPHEETLHPWLSKTRSEKILIRLRECAGWSESSLGAQLSDGTFPDDAAHINYGHTLTSSIFVTEKWESPYVGEIYSKSYHRQEKVYFLVPRLSLLFAITIL